MWPAVIAGVSQLASSALGYLGAQQQGQESFDMLNQQEAFQQNMSNTSYQRATADMKAAGINPMLAVTNGGASTPSGASIPVPQTGMSALGQSLPGLTSSALDTIKTMQDLKESNSRIISNEANASDATASSFLKDRQNLYTQVQTDLGRLQRTILGSEAGVVGSNPMLSGWLKMLQDRGVGGSSALGLLSSAIP